MIPEYFPVLVADDILEPPSEEYEVGEVRSAIGWLKFLFLYSYNPKTPHLIQITDQDRKDFQKSLDFLRKCGKIQGSIGDWEDKVSSKVQAKILNEVRKALKYTEIEDR